MSISKTRKGLAVLVMSLIASPVLSQGTPGEPPIIKDPGGPPIDVPPVIKGPPGKPDGVPPEIIFK